MGAHTVGSELRELQQAQAGLLWMCTYVCSNNHRRLYPEAAGACCRRRYLRDDLQHA